MYKVIAKIKLNYDGKTLVKGDINAFSELSQKALNNFIERKYIVKLDEEELKQDKEELHQDEEPPQKDETESQEDETESQEDETETDINKVLSVSEIEKLNKNELIKYANDLGLEGINSKDKTEVIREKVLGVVKNNNEL